jgi:hypothetical protein
VEIPQHYNITLHHIEPLASEEVDLLREGNTINASDLIELTAEANKLAHHDLNSIIRLQQHHKLKKPRKKFLMVLDNSFRFYYPLYYHYLLWKIPTIFLDFTKISNS